MLNHNSFKLWHYTVSHSQMLIRKPKCNSEDCNIDFFFKSVEYLSVPSIMNNLLVESADDKTSKLFLNKMAIENGKAYEYGLKLYLLSCDEGQYYVVAGSMIKSKNNDDIFDISRYELKL